MTTKPTNPKDTIGIRKAPMSVVPANVMAEVAVGLLEGATKYGRHNYRVAGIRASVYYDAAMRHLMSWWEGQDSDPDPQSAGLSHVTKAITSLVVLRDAMMHDMMNDDRPPKSKTFMEELNKVAGELIDKNADKNPEHYVETSAPLRQNVPMTIKQQDDKDVEANDRHQAHCARSFYP